MVEVDSLAKQVEDQMQSLSDSLRPEQQEHDLNGDGKINDIA